MIVVMPDARYAGGADIEQAVFGERAELRCHKAAALDDIPDEDWQAAEALRNNRIAAAGLGVFPEEPPNPDHPLFAALKAGEDWTIGRVIVTSHVAWYSPDGAHDAREKAAKTVIAYLADGALRTCVNEGFLVGGG